MMIMIKESGGYMKKNKVDCIVELGEEKYAEGMMAVVRDLLANGFSADVLSKNTTLPLKKIQQLEKEIKASQ